MNSQKEKSLVYKNVEYKFSSEWIHKLEDVRHWLYYWKQQEQLSKVLADGDTILEIGIGSGFTSNYLRSKGYEVTTIDIDRDKNPDIVANVVEHQFHEKFDHILAFEVFEHIPYEEFKAILNKLKSITRKNLVMSVPRNIKTIFEFEALLPLLGNISWRLDIPKRKITTSHHFWELGYQEYSLSRIKQDLAVSGFGLKNVSKFKSLSYLTAEKS